MANKNNLIGRTFGKWVVLDYSGKSKNGSIKYLCRCECGLEKAVTGSDLTIGKTSSCKACSKLKHGDCGTALYMVWGTLVQRCTNPKNKGYANYGGRGITLCDEWRNNYATFRDWAVSNGYAHGLLIERIDNNKGYSPQNCTFSTREVQNNNKRNCRYVVILGVKLSIARQAARLGISKDTLRHRMNRGITGDDLIAGLKEVTT